MAHDALQERMRALGLVNNGTKPVVPGVTHQPLSAVQKREKLDMLLEKNGIEPAEELIKMAMDKRVGQDGVERFVLDAKARIDIFKEILSYQMPKLKAIQLEGKIDHAITINIVRFTDLGATNQPAAPEKPVVDVEEVKK